MNPYDQEDEQNVEDYWQRLKDSGRRPALQDEVRAGWNNWSERSYQLRVVARQDFERWEDEQEQWWNGGCR